MPSPAGLPGGKLKHLHQGRLNITGRPEIRDGRVYVSTRDEMVALDGETRAAVDGAIASLAGFLGAEGIDGL